MSLRKINSSNSSVTTTQHAVSYIKEFCAQACQYRGQQNDESILLLVNRSASLLITVVEPQHFHPRLLEVSKFFIDLHAVMGDLAIESDALWSCVNLLQHCSRNLDARQAIVEEYRFVPLLACLLKRTHAPEKIKRLLSLIQELTFGIRLTWEEPYLVVMFSQLVAITCCAAEDPDQMNAQLALSVLINLCYKNFVGKFLFLRSVHISSFSRKIQSFGMLARKMLIILADDMHMPNEKELYLFLHSTLSDIGDCIREWNVPHMRHIVDFLVDSTTFGGLHRAMLCYDGYCEDLERILNQLEERCSMDDSNEETRRHQQLCIGLLFQLIYYILELGMLPHEYGGDNIISLDSNVPRIFELLCNWFDSDICGINAVNLAAGIIEMAKKESVAPRFARDPSILVELITILKKSDTTAAHKASILGLLRILLRQPKTEKIVLSKISTPFFNELLDPLLSLAAELSEISIPDADIEKYVTGLLLLVNCATIDPATYLELCTQMLELVPFQYVLARAMLNGKKQVCVAAYQTMRFEHFSLPAVAQQMVSLQSSRLCRLPTNTAPDAQWRDLSGVLKSHKTFISKEVEERLQALVEVISDAQRKNQLNNVAASQIIELYNYKIEKFVCAEFGMQQRMERASDEITVLSQRLNMQSAELQKYQTMNLDMHVNMENLQTRCKDLNEQKDNIRANMTEHIKLLSEQKKSLQITEKQMAVKCAEVTVLEKELLALKDQLQIKGQELEKSQATAKENAQRIEKLKKSVGACELSIKDKQRLIEDKDRELTKTNKMLDEQRDAKKKADDVITVLEAQLQEKTEKINNYEKELNESEEVRKAIMSLMGSKKAKRAAN